jgi:heat shock protein HslJ
MALRESEALMCWNLALIILLGIFPSSPIPEPPARAELVGTYWKAVELAGARVPGAAAERQAHLVLQADGRFSGSDGCNRVTGGYTLKGNGVTFGQVAGTMMACPDTDEISRRFHSALKGTSHWSIVGDRLQLLGATGKPLAVFEPGQPASPPASSSRLEGTSWQLVKFQGSDDTVLTPDDPTRYTLDFGKDGRLSARVDCNRGNATWKSAEPSQLELGPLALTRAKCQEGSLHDFIVKQWPHIRSYVIKDGHLFVALMADAGIFEFAPRVAKQ